MSVYGVKMTKIFCIPGMTLDLKVKVKHAYTCTTIFQKNFVLSIFFLSFFYLLKFKFVLSIFVWPFYTTCAVYILYIL